MTGDIRLVLETDAIVSPLTGIGRYTLALLEQFVQREEFADIRCFSRGRWKSADKLTSPFFLAKLANLACATTANTRPWTKNPARILLKRLLPHVQRYTLGKLRDTHLYHSPNYRLTPYAGRKIATFHDLSVLKYPEYHPRDRLDILGPAIDRAAQEADHLITDSEYVRREVIDYFGLKEESVTAIHLASSLGEKVINLDARDQFLQQLGLSAGSYLLFVSTLEPRKNIEGLVTAYELIPQSMRSKFPLVLAGQLGWSSDGIAKALQPGLKRGDILQTGYLTNQELAYLYSSARALVFPSLYEGFGLPVVEAQSFGTPVITSNCSCLPEITAGSAVLVDPDDYDALSLAMQELIDDQKMCVELSEAGQQNVKRYSWENTASETIEVYQKIMRSD
jgi:glycosyltransferase involved in cell wall biosynthesis